MLTPKAVGTDFLAIQSVNKEGRIALVGFSFTNRDEGSGYLLKTKFRKMSGWWQLAELTNLNELLEQFQREEMSALAVSTSRLQSE
jgi:hypothetical protein